MQLITNNRNCNKMKNRNLYELKEAISRVNSRGNNKFKLALLINEKMIDERIESLEKLREQSEEFKNFEQKRQEIIVAHAETDDSGQVIVYSQPGGNGEKTSNAYGYPNIIKDKEECEQKLADLQEEYKETIDAEVKKQTDFAETLNQPVEPEMKFNAVPFENVPEIEYEEMKVLMPFIEN